MHMKRIDFENGTVTGNILGAALPMLVAQDHHQYDSDPVCLRIRLSEISCGTGDGSILWSCICCCDAFLYLSYQKPSGWKIPGLADIPVLLGM